MPDWFIEACDYGFNFVLDRCLFLKYWHSMGDGIGGWGGFGEEHEIGFDRNNKRIRFRHHI